MALIHPNMTMSGVVEGHTSLIPVLNRLGIRLGLQDKSVREVCEEHGLDTDFVLIILNAFLNEEYFPERRLKMFHVSQIIDYLDKTNQYYLRYQLPNIARHTHSFITQSTPVNATLGLIGRFFASFEEQLTRRIHEDEQEWFPYCLALSRCLEENPTFDADTPFAIPDEPALDDPIEALLADLKRIMIKHLSGAYNENLCYAVIFAISSLEKDIKQHNRIRNRILKPMVKEMELIEKTSR
ncbi:helix-turn-helix transcriptional regulator [Parabacteroides sp. An277]|nr:helix-turn-helix transcriptional regulator [Parabacteroides sp. An277]